MNERNIYLLSALAGGAILPIQVALNTLLKRYVSEPMQVTFISYLAGTLAWFAICFFARYAIPTWTSLAQTSWWMWIGGCLRTLYVWSTIFARRRDDSRAFLRSLWRDQTRQISCQSRTNYRSCVGGYRRFIRRLCEALAHQLQDLATQSKNLR